MTDPYWQLSNPADIGLASVDIESDEGEAAPRPSAGASEPPPASAIDEAEGAGSVINGLGGPGRRTGPGPLETISGLSGQPTPEILLELLRDVMDPEVGINIVDLGLIYDIGLPGDGLAVIRMTLTTPGCPLSGYMDDAIHEILWGVPGVRDVDTRIVWDPPWDPDVMMSDWAKEQLGWRR